MKRFSRRQFVAGGALAAFGSTLALAGCAPMSHDEAQEKEKEASAQRASNSQGQVTAIGQGM